MMMLLLAIVANAQMSEKQIIQYVQKQSAAGKDQQTIAKELIAKGVSIQQLEKLRNKYQSMKGGSSSVSGSEEFSRIRISNAEEKEQEIDYFPFLEQEEEKEDIKEEIKNPNKDLKLIITNEVSNDAEYL